MSKRRTGKVDVVKGAAKWLPLVFGAVFGAAGVHAQTSGVAPLVSGDCTASAAGVMTCTKSGGAAFAASATTDTTNAANIVSGTLPNARLGATVNGKAISGNPTLGAADVGADAAGAAAAVATQLNAEVTRAQGAETTNATNIANEISSRSAAVAAEATLARNAANLSSGTLLAARMPAMSGDCTSAAGSGVLACNPSARYTPGQVVYEKSYWSDLSDFTTFGSPGLSLSNGKVVTTAANTGNFVNGVYLKNTANNDDDLDIEVVLTTGQGSGAYGFASGKVASNAIANIAWGMGAIFNPYNANLQAQTYYVQTGGAFSQLGTYAAGGAVTNGGVYKVVYSQRGSRFTSLIYDYTLGGVTTFASYVPMTNCTPKFPNSDYAGFWNNGGTYTIQSIRVVSRKPQQPELAVVGDSKTFGCTAGARDLRYGSALSSLGPVAVYAGSGDTTASVLADLPYVLANKPKRVLLNIGRNDLAQGIASATWQGNYLSIVSQLKAAGVSVTHLLPIPETAQDQTALKSYITTTFAGDSMIDPATGWSNSTMLAADGIHPNAAGHAYLASVILASGNFPVVPLRPVMTTVATEALYPATVY